jgi:parallel beta-helix repeat protein
MKLLFTLVGFFMLFNVNAADITIYVSPHGKGSGERNNTSTTLQKAVAMLPELKKRNPKGKIIFILQDGEYELSQPIYITPENGGTNDLEIIFKAANNAHPVISGGKKVAMTGNQLLKAFAPDLARYQSHDLYVNGKRAIRARTPNIDNYFTVGKIETKVDPRQKFYVTQQYEMPVSLFNELTSFSKSDLQKVWFNIYCKWDNTMRTIDSLSIEKKAFISTGTILGDFAFNRNPSIFYVENYLKALDAPNEWYLDNDTIKYIPVQATKNQVAVMPVLEKLLVIKGDSIMPVRNILFDGIAFKYCNVRFKGYQFFQAAQMIDASIMVDNADGVVFTNCEVAHTGQYGIWLREGVKNAKITNCYLHDLGAGGIRIGETVIRENKTQWTSGNQVENCIIHSGGLNFPSGVGVFIAHSANNIIAHNDIADFRYTGISVGWIWGYGFNPSVNNKVLYNHIHHIGWGVLSDMAAIYTLGISDGTEVSNNIIHDIYSYDYGGWGLYTDEGSSNIKMENNLVYRTKTGGFHQHYGKNNLIKNNIFALNEKFQAQFTLVEGHHSFDFKNNIVISDKGALLQGPWLQGDIALDSNLYWNMNSRKSIFLQSSHNPTDTLGFAQWRQKSSRDAHSVFKDPNFIAPENGDFRFKNKSALKSIGFRSFNLKEPGVFGPEKWRRQAELPKEVIDAFNASVAKNMLH